MNFTQLLNSLDDLLYEVMSWLVFYPITLLRVIRHPVTTMNYAAVEFAKDEGDRFAATLSPPLFLLVSLTLSHVIAINVGGDAEIISDKHGVATLVNDDTSLIVLRLLLFAILPIFIAAYSLRTRKATITRYSLKVPFYAQCYPAGAFALLVGLASDLMVAYPTDSGLLTAAGLIVVITIGYWIAQVRWFKQYVGDSLWRALLHATIAFGISSLIFTAVMFLIALSL